ncbi:MAG: O-antigen ligase family protein, partial [Fibrobacterota bacterium]
MFFLFILLPMFGPTGELSWYFIPGEILFIISTLAVITVTVCRSRETMHLSFSKNEILVWLFFLSSALLSSCNASHLFPSVHGFVMYAFIGIAIMYLRTIPDSDQFTKTYSLIAIGGALFISIIFLFITAFSVLDHLLFSDRTGAIISSLVQFGNKEYLAATIGISFVVFFFSPIRRNGGEFIVYGIIGIALLLLNVRGVIAAVIGALLITKALKTESVIARKYLVSGIIILSTMLAALLTLSLLQNTIPIVRLHTISGRVLLWIMSIPMIVDSAGTGIGIGNIEFHVIPSLISLFSHDYMTPFSSSASMVRRIHNEYLDFIVEGGLLLGACYAFILLVTYKRMRKDCVEFSSDNSSALAGMLFILLLSLWSSPLHNIQVLFLGGCCIARLLGARFTQSDPVFSVAISTGISRIVCAVLLSGSIVYFFIIWNANNNHTDAIKSLSDNSCVSAILLIDKITKPIQSSDQIYTAIVAKASLGKFDDAKRDCSMLIHKGATIDILKVYGSLLFNTKEYARAQGVYHTLSQAFPEQITPLYMLGKIAFEKGNFNEARKMFTLVLTKKPKSIKAQSERADAEEYLRKIDIMQTTLNPEMN